MDDLIDTSDDPTMVYEYAKNIGNLSRRERDPSACAEAFPLCPEDPDRMIRIAMRKPEILCPFHSEDGLINIKNSIEEQILESF